MNEQTAEQKLLDLIKEVELGNLRRNELCIFAGAGISYNSGVPLVNAIKEYIVDKMCDEEQERESLLRNKIPFEIFIEILLNSYRPNDVESTSKPLELTAQESKVYQAIENALAGLLKFAVFGDIFQEHRSFFELFDNSNYFPNANHYFIARMLDSGYAKFAVTTNFDVLIEKAYKEIANKDLLVYFPGAEKTENYQFPCLIKVHGGCQELSTIKTTIDKIASDAAIDLCQQTIEYTFNGGEHSKILILGYSFSDIFDISPSIENVKGSKKSVVNINHNVGQANHPGTIKRRLDECQSIFSGFSGFQIDCNTDEAICALWKIYFKGAEPDGLAVRNTGPILNDIIGKWATRLSEPHQKFFICGLLMTFVKRFEEAKKYYLQCLATREIQENQPLKIAVLQNLVMVDPVGSSVQKSELESLLQTANTQSKIRSLVNEVPSKLLKSDSAGAISCCDQAITMAREIKDNILEGGCYASLAHVFNTRKEYKQAADAGEKALILIKDSNRFDVLSSRCRIYSCLATSYENLNMEEKKREYSDKALELARKLNIENEMAALYFSLAHSVDTKINRRENLRKCIGYFKLGYDFCKNNIDSIEPLIRDSALFLLGANIVLLHLEDERLVTSDELNLAYELIAKQVNGHLMDRYGDQVMAETGSIMGLVCMALHKYDEAMDALLTTISSINFDQVSRGRQSQLFYVLLLWFQRQPKHCLEYTDHKFSVEEADNITLKLREAIVHFQDNQISVGAQVLKNAFQYIPVNYSFMSLPYCIYRDLVNIREMFYRIHNRLSKSNDVQDKC